MRRSASRGRLLFRQVLRPLGLSLVLTATCGVAHAQSPQYTFTKITDSVLSPGLGSASCAGLNNLGTVIVTFAPTGSDYNQVWRGNGGPFAAVAQRTGGLCASINDLDEIAYITFDAPPFSHLSSLVRNSNGVLTTLARSDVSPFLSGNTPLPSLNSGGSAVFMGGGASGAGPGSGIYVAPAGPTIYDAATDPPLTFQPSVSLNDSATAVFLAFRNGVSGVYRESFVRTGIPLIESGNAVPGGTIGIATARPVINNSGTVAFVGTLAGTFGVYSTHDGSSVTLLGTSPVDRIAINDSGAVVFRKTLSGGAGSGIYMGRPGAIDQEVIGQGDDLDGSKLQDALIWEEAINNRGQIVFRARLLDGRVGIYRADPIDSTAPVVTPPDPITVDATELPGATGNASAALATFLAGGSATDDMDPSPLRLTPQVGGVDATNATVFPIGTTEVAFRFQDASGNVGTATSAVTVVSPQRHLLGSGYNFPEVAYRATFSVDVRGPLSPSGTVKYYYTRTRLNLVSTAITGVSVAGGTAVIEGAASVNGLPGFSFTAIASDGNAGSGPAMADSFGITVRRSDGSVLFSAGSKPLAGGSLAMTVP